MSSHSGRSLNGNELPAFLILNETQQLSQTAMPSPGVCRERLGEAVQLWAWAAREPSLYQPGHLFITQWTARLSFPCDFLFWLHWEGWHLNSHIFVFLIFFEILSFPHPQNFIYFLKSTLYEYCLGKSDLREKHSFVLLLFSPKRLNYITIIKNNEIWLF